MKKRTQWFIPLLCLAGLFLCSCGKERKSNLPMERSERLLEILRLLDMKEYTAALPKIEEYRQIDETNAFLGELRNIVVTNTGIQKAERLAAENKLDEACAVLDEFLVKYGQLPGLLEARANYKRAQEIREQIEQLKKPQLSTVMAAAGRRLLSIGTSLRRPALVRFARQIILDSSSQKTMENDRAGFLLYADALDALAERDQDSVMTVLAVLESQKRFPAAASRIRGGGIFFMELPEVKKEQTTTGGAGKVSQ